MPLTITAGQYSAAGLKPANQDFHGLFLPKPPQLASKGIAVALADGISTSEFSRQASEAAVTGFLDDYYCTSEAWSVKTSVERVLAATNSWLFAQTQQGQGRYDKDRGWACTFSALVIKSRTAHIFHVGDTRIYQVQGRALEQLTTDHRVHVGGGQSYLGRAMGIAGQLEIDYRTVALMPGDVFVLATDGVYEHVRDAHIVQAIADGATDLDAAARTIAEDALRNGSQDNVTVQIVRIDALPDAAPNEISRLAGELPFPPALEPRMLFDGLRIVRELHASSRSHVLLAVDERTGEKVVLKTPSTELRDDAAYRERFLLEEWVARRVDSAHVLKPSRTTRPRSHLYVAMEYVEGRTLTQWMVDHPRPPLDEVRRIVDQVARGLRALHRLEMLHHDLRPENILVDTTGTAKIIDFGSTRVAGIAEAELEPAQELPLGTVQYMAPEYLQGQGGSQRSDLFSLAVITYQMLTGRLPYGADMARSRTPADAARLRYRSVREVRQDVPDWVDEALRKALQPQAQKRHGDVPEFVHALHRPDPDVVPRKHQPLLERNPLRFWQAVSLLLAIGWLATAAAWRLVR